MTTKIFSKHKSIFKLSGHYYPFSTLTSSSKSNDNLILCNVNDKTGYTIVELNRPPVNSLNLELLAQFSHILDDCERNKCRGMIVTSVSEMTE